MKRIARRIGRFFWYDLSGSSSVFKLTAIYSVPFLVIFGVLLALLISWEIRKHRAEQIETLLDTARSFYNQLMMEKHWIDTSGGIYVLKEDARAVDESGGGGFRRIDFAYMVGRIAMIAGENRGFGLHIAGTGLGMGVHAPDEWEKAALSLMADNDRREVFGLEDVNGEPVFRYFRPVASSTPADVSAGGMMALTITIPASVSTSIHAAKVRRDIVSYTVIGGVAVMFIVFIVWRFSRRISASITREMEEGRLRAAMELAGATAHEMRQPLSVIMGFSELLKHRIGDGKDIEDTLDVITEQCRRTDDIITKMLNITHYRTMKYADGVEIFDLHAQGSSRSTN